MKISVIIATRNRSEMLRGCLESIMANSRLPEEIAVIDQSDGDATAAVVRECASRTSIAFIYERMKPLGKASALNRAMHLCAGEFLASTDDDVRVPPDWLSNCQSAAEKNPEIAVFCGQVLPEELSAGRDYLNLVLESAPKRITRRSNPFHSGFCGANIFFQRAAVVTLGGFHPLFGPGAPFRNNDDGELAYRVTRAGMPIAYDPSIKVAHLAWRNSADNLRLKFDYAFSQGALAGYYARRGDWALPGFLALEILRKSRRLLIGLALAQKERISDGYCHLKGFLLGLIRGFSVSPGQEEEAVNPVSDFYMNRDPLRRMIRKWAADPRALTLDLGCKKGDISHSLSRATGKLVAVDKTAFPEWQAVGSGIDFIRADAHHLPFLSARFDTVVASEILQYIPDPSAALAEIRRALKPGGLLVLSFPGHCPFRPFLHPYNLISRFKPPGQGHPRVYFHRPEAIAEPLREDMRLEKHERRGTLLMVYCAWTAEKLQSARSCPTVRRIPLADSALHLALRFVFRIMQMDFGLRLGNFSYTHVMAFRKTSQ